MSGNGHLRHVRRNSIWLVYPAGTGVLQDPSLVFCESCRWCSAGTVAGVLRELSLVFYKRDPGPQKPGIAFLRTPNPHEHHAV
jgi:hypothetical protein